VVGVGVVVVGVGGGGVVVEEEEEEVDDDLAPPLGFFTFHMIVHLSWYMEIVEVQWQCQSKWL